MRAVVLQALLLLAMPLTEQQFKARLLDERCATLCPVIGKGDTGNGLPDGKCACVNIVDPYYYLDKRLALPTRMKQKKEQQGSDVAKELREYFEY